MVCICVLVGLETQAASPTPKENSRQRKNQDMDGNAEVLHYDINMLVLQPSVECQSQEMHIV